MELTENFEENERGFRYNNIPERVFTDKKNPLILELGCGNGKRQLTSVYAKYFQTNYLGLDIFKFDSELNIKQIDIMDYSFEKNSIDILLAFEILEHIPLRDWNYLTNKMKECIRPNGYIVITTPYKEQLEKYCYDTLENRRYFQIHNVHNITKGMLEYFFQNSKKNRLLRYGFRKRFWKGFSDSGIMTIWKKE